MLAPLAATLAGALPQAEYAPDGYARQRVLDVLVHQQRLGEHTDDVRSDHLRVSVPGKGMARDRGGGGGVVCLFVC